jgi:hypothetical protein
MVDMIAQTLNLKINKPLSDSLITHPGDTSVQSPTRAFLKGENSEIKIRKIL